MKIARIFCFTMMLGALLSIPRGAFAQQAAAQPEAEIEAFVRSYFDAWSKADFVRYRACFHSAATIDYRPGEYWKRWDLATFLDDQERMQTAQRAEEKPLAINVKARGADTAFVEIHWRLQHPPRTDSVTGVDWFTLVKTGDQWRILHLTFWQDAENKPKGAGADIKSGAAGENRKIIVSGFDPFNGRSVNASTEVAKAIKDGFPQFDITFVQVPVIWGAPMQSIVAQRPLSPDVWIAFGEGLDTFRIETVADNYRGKARDNLKQFPAGQEIVEAGPVELKLNEAAEVLNEDVQRLGLACTVSSNAGKYLCEEMLYSLLSEQANPQTTLKHVFFMHVPIYGHTTQFNADEVPFSGDTLKTAARSVFQAMVAQLQLKDSQ